MSHRRGRSTADANTDTNADADDALTLDTDTSLAASIERVLSHAESHGEAYTGAVADHTTIRAALTDGRLVLKEPEA